MADEWIKRLQVGIAEIREREAGRTLLFRKRAEVLWKTCFAVLQALALESNSTLRNSNLVLRLQRSDHAALPAWIQLEMCKLQENGSPGEVYYSLRLKTALDGIATYEPENPDYLTVDLDNLNETSLREVLYGFVMAAVTAHFENPKSDLHPQIFRAVNNGGSMSTM